MNPLEAKKRALAAESEVYRETLKLELQNLRLYGIRAKQNLTRFVRPHPLVMLLGPLLGTLFKRRRKSLFRRAVTTLISWQVWNRLLPFLNGLLSQRPGGKEWRRGEARTETFKRENI